MRRIIVQPSFLPRGRIVTDDRFPVPALFYRNVGVRGGAAPARTYIPELVGDVLEGRIDPGRVLDYETDLEGIGEAYAAMDERRAIKSLVRVGSL